MLTKEKSSSAKTLARLAPIWLPCGIKNTRMIGGVTVVGIKKGLTLSLKRIIGRTRAVPPNTAQKVL
jgi:hypothetical protein